MRCPVCGADDTKVIDSRPANGGSAIRRRRSCGICGNRFTTYERGTPLLMVRKRSGQLEPFSSDKLGAGVMAAVADRPVAAHAVAELVEEIEAKVGGRSGPVTSEEIGRLVLDGLRRLDEVAYLRFASVYKDFQHAGDFEREMAVLGEAGSGSGVSSTKGGELANEDAALGLGVGDHV
ncbi:MAG: transcriptional regulator NrdR [Acidimicrobiia bacterium]|nr:transcriptional regulator NrdR [Acidimicrobiia bacterium]